MTLKEIVTEYPQLKTVLLGAGAGVIGYQGAKYARRKGKRVNPALIASLAALAPLGYEFATGTGTGGNIYQKGIRAAVLPTSSLGQLPNTRRYFRNYVRSQVGGMNPEADPGTDLYTGKLPINMFGNHAYKNGTGDYKRALTSFADNMYNVLEEKYRLTDPELKVLNVPK